MNQILKAQLIAYAIKYNGEYHQIRKAIIQNEQWQPVTNPQCITILDENYPNQLFQLEYPPFVLFYEGDLTLMNDRCIAIIGSRNVCAYGEMWTRKIVEALRSRYVIVSGMAKGVDAIAHEEAFKTIGVLGCGIDVCYPKQNAALYQKMKEQQLLISEYPPHTKPLAHHFPWRNRIIAALSKHVIVTQAAYRSGTMHTVNEALALGLEISCIPYPLGSEKGEGCNLLISQGANILIGIDEIKNI